VFNRLAKTTPITTPIARQAITVNQIVKTNDPLSLFFKWLQAAISAHLSSLNPGLGGLQVYLKLT